MPYKLYGETLYVHVVRSRCIILQRIGANTFLITWTKIYVSVRLYIFLYIYIYGVYIILSLGGRLDSSYLLYKPPQCLT